MYRKNLHKNIEMFISVCFRSMVKEQKTSKAFQYDSPPELLEHDKRIKKSETVENNTT